MPRKTNAPANARKRDALGRFVAVPVRLRDDRGRFAKSKPAPKSKGVPKTAPQSRAKHKAGATTPGRAEQPAGPKRGRKAPPLPVYTVQRQRGRTYIRDAQGRIVSEEQAAKGKVIRIVREGKTLRRLKDATGTKSVKGYAPKPHGRFVASELFAKDAARVIEDEAVRGRKMLVKWNGEVYAVRPEDAGIVSDAFRAVVSEYVDAFAPHLESPQMRFGFVETMNGKRDYTLIDADRIETLDEELLEELETDHALQKAAHKFNGRLARLLGGVFTPTWKEEPPHKPKPKPKRAAPKRRRK